MVEEQSEVNGGLPWDNLYIFGIEQDLEVCFGFGIVHFLLMAMVGLHIPTQVLSEPAAAYKMLRASAQWVSCLWWYVLMDFVRILKHGS